MTFTLYETAAVTITTAGASGDTQLWLYDADLNVLRFDNDGATGRFSSIHTDRLSPGTYFAKANSNGGNQQIESYRLSLDSDGGVAVECDYYTLKAGNGHTFSICLEPAESGFSTRCDNADRNTRCPMPRVENLLSSVKIETKSFSTLLKA